MNDEKKRCKDLEKEAVILKAVIKELEDNEDSEEGSVEDET